MIAEMIHTASLIHDDVIDASTMRRGKPSVQSQWGQKKVQTFQKLFPIKCSKSSRIFYNMPKCKYMQPNLQLNCLFSKEIEIVCCFLTSLLSTIKHLQWCLEKFPRKT